MTRIRLKHAVSELGGTLYEVDLRRSHDREPTATKHPHKSRPYNGKASEAQKMQRQRFKEAAGLAKAALADPQLRAHYEEMAQQQGKQAWNVAVAEYLKEQRSLSR